MGVMGYIIHFNGMLMGFSIIKWDISYTLCEFHMEIAWFLMLNLLSVSFVNPMLPGSWEGGG
jgi:hypothetical protein